MGEESNLVATLDNNLGFMNSFGDAYSTAELNSRPELLMQLEDCLKVANEKRRADKENNIKLKAKANFKLFAEPESAEWKGHAKVRAQLSSMIKFYGYGTNQSENKYGAGPSPPFFPPSVDWATFKGPGKVSMKTNTTIIVYMKKYQDAVDAGVDPAERVDDAEDTPEIRIDDEDIIGQENPEDIVDDAEDTSDEENAEDRTGEEGGNYIEIDNVVVEDVEGIQFVLEHPAEGTSTEVIKRTAPKRKIYEEGVKELNCLMTKRQKKTPKNLLDYDLNDETESEESDPDSSRRSVAQHIADQGDSEDSFIDW